MVNSDSIASATGRLCIPLCVRTALLLLPSTGDANDRGFSADVEAALSEMKREPTIQQTQKAALEFFRIDPNTINSMRTRAGWKSVLPSVSVKTRINNSDVYVDRADWTVRPQYEPVGIDDATTETIEFEVAGSWDLPRLIFNSEVLDVSSLVVLQEAILKEITRLYYTRRRLQVDIILSPPADPATRLSKELRIEELTSTLDAMTGNIFATYFEQKTRATKKRRRRRRPR